MSFGSTFDPGAQRIVHTHRGSVRVGLVAGAIVVVMVVVAVLLAPAVLFSSLSPVGMFAPDPSSVVIEVEGDSGEFIDRLSSSLVTNMGANLAAGAHSPDQSSEFRSSGGLFFAQRHSYASRHSFVDRSGGVEPIAAPFDFDAFVDDMNALLPGLLDGAPSDSTQVVVRYGLPDGTAILTARVEYVDGVATFVTSRESSAPE